MELLVGLLIYVQGGSWVDQLRNQDGGVCCYNSDGRRLDDPEWRVTKDHYEVLFTEGWIQVPDWAVVQGRNEDGIVRVWSQVDPSSTRSIRCFLRGAFG